uniref:Uncharacterized protein n=1 Tax=Rhodnius prolixus TaxID=13249 RepID=T1HNP8_RHOPR
MSHPGMECSKRGKEECSEDNFDIHDGHIIKPSECSEDNFDIHDGDIIKRSECSEDIFDIHDGDIIKRSECSEDNFDIHDGHIIKPSECSEDNFYIHDGDIIKPGNRSTRRIISSDSESNLEDTDSDSTIENRTELAVRRLSQTESPVWDTLNQL